jgi:hypothetical protein
MNRPDCPPSPFVGLVPFREADAPFFRGRDTERDLIVENLRASRLTLLYGTSGVGKSSVIYAGAAHRLRELARQDVQEYGKPEFAVVTFNAWRDDPIQGLLRSINEAVADALQVKSLAAVPESGDLAQAINAWTERYGIELLIILDQFEEYFQYRPGEQGRGTFAEEFPRAVNDPDLRAKFLLSLRDDALSKLDRFKSQIPNLFNNLLRIRHMNEEAARKAIVEPIEEYNDRCGFKQAGQEYSIESALVEEVTKQVRAGRDASDEAGGVAGIEAPYLQLVMSRLWEKEHEEGSRVLRKQTLEDLEGIKNIVQVYLNNALALLTPEQKDVAFRIFDYLVTPSGTKIAYFKSDLIGQTEFPETQIGDVLDALNKSRILRPVPSVDRPDESRYEVFHDLLAQAILKWRTQYEATTKAEAKQAAAAAELAEAERQRREAASVRENRRLWGGVTALVFLLVITVGFAIYAFKKSSEADKLQKELTHRQQLRLSELEEMIRKEKDPERRKILEEAAIIFRSEKQRSLTEGQERAIRQKQQQESTSGRQVEARDEIRRKLWQNGKTLHIKFIGGDPALQQRIAQVAQEWMQAEANIKFVFDNAPGAEIHIGFDDPGSWSYIGTDALGVPANQPTMNFGLLTEENITDDVFRRTVLHEFGHVLGLIHEHQNPNANIPWNKDAVYAFFTSPPYNWTRDMVDQNFFEKYTGEYRKFDPQSIMMYFPITQEFLLGDTFKAIPELSTVLSEKDKEYLRVLYPPN